MALTDFIEKTLENKLSLYVDKLCNKYSIIDRLELKGLIKENLGINVEETRREFLEKEWDPDNEYPFSKYKNGSNFKAKWICSKNNNHKWEAMINNRTNKDNLTNCPYCAGKICKDKSNSLGKLRPDLEKEWDSTNEFSIFDVSVGSEKIAKWICYKNSNHKWNAIIYNRTKNNPTGCPYCANRKICKDKSNSLGKLRPDLKIEWDLSNDITPEEVLLGSTKIVKWICSKNFLHKWEAKVFDRTRKDGKDTGCPICKESHGEKFVSKYLTGHNIEFTTQYKISYNECPKLSFDFYIEKYNTLIEFDGIQHFDIIPYFGGEEKFQLQIRNDNYKNSYCKENNITLIRFHHLDINDTNHLSDLISQIDIENPRIITSKNYPKNWVK